MRVVLKKVYYCDFCKKKSFRPLTQHEKHCTGNPDRTCRMCNEGINVRGLAQTIVLNPGDRTTGDGPEIPMEVIYGITECPACILALLREIRRISPDGAYEHPSFHYKEARDQWWKDHQPEEEGVLSPGY